MDPMVHGCYRERTHEDKRGELVLSGQAIVFTSTLMNLNHHHPKIMETRHFIFSSLLHLTIEYFSFMRKKKLVSQLFSLGMSMNLLKISLKGSNIHMPT